MRKRPARKKVSVPKIRFGLIFVIILGVFGVFLIIIWNLLPSTWDTKSRIVVATVDSDQQVYTTIFDTQTHSLVKILIPGNTLIDTANGLGMWQVSSIVKLGQNEGMGLNLLSLSITKGLSLPVDAFAEEGAIALTDPNFINIIISAFSENQTNLTLKDKINLGLFSLRTKNSDRETINLEDTGMLRKKTLPGGDDGFVVTGSVPSSLAVHFSDPLFESSFRFTVIDSSGENLSPKIGNIVEVLGGKVFSVIEKQINNSDCLIIGDQMHVVDRIAGVFSCSKEIKKTQSGFDIEIYLGTQFAKRF